MKIQIISGSRADLGLLHCPEKALRTDFDVQLVATWDNTYSQAFIIASERFRNDRPDMILVLGDRFEILAAVTAAHLQRIPIAHIGGGDVTEGSYDDAMRDCISRMASVHFTTSFASTARLVARGYSNVHLVGNPAVDYIMHEAWQREREIAEPYVVISYQPETIDSDFGAGQHIGKIFAELPDNVKRVFVRPNPDRGSDLVNDIINGYEKVRDVVIDTTSHDRFLNLLYHCECFIGNSSSMFYEAPFLKPGGIKCRMIGKRQRGRNIPWGGDGKASERILDVLRLWPSS